MKERRTSIYTHSTMATKTKPIVYESIPHKVYGYPHGATNPMQASLLNQKHASQQQNEMIRGGRRKRRRRYSRKSRKSRKPSRKARKSKKAKRTKRSKRHSTSRYRKRARTSSRRRSRRSRRGGSGTKPITTPHFTNSNPVSPTGPNALSKSVNATYLQNHANAKYDSLHSSSPKQVTSF